MAVFYNPSAGMIQGLGEAFPQRYLGPTEIDKQFARVLRRLSAEDIPVEIIAYSQGVLTAVNALSMGISLEDKSKLITAGSPFSRSKVLGIGNAGNADTSFIPNNFLDPVNMVQAENPLLMYGGYLGGKFDTLTQSRYSAHKFEKYAPQILEILNR